MPEIRSTAKWYWIILLKLYLALPLDKPRRILRYIDYKTNFRIYYIFRTSEFNKLTEDFASFKATGVPDTGSYSAYTLIGEPTPLNLSFDRIYDVGS
jgi:surface polysaccharide O-acyltransferase-like enzyme